PPVRWRASVSARPSATVIRSATASSMRSATCRAACGCSTRNPTANTNRRTEMQVFHGRAAGGKSDDRTGSTFTGNVWADPVMPATDGVTINTVFFAPGGRTYWHAHERGQILHVTAGQ